MMALTVTTARGRELARIVYDVIVANRKRYYQYVYVSMGSQEAVDVTNVTDPTECGTALCIAGWTTVLVGGRIDCFGIDLQTRKHVAAVAQEALGLTRKQSVALFESQPEDEALHRLLAYANGGDVMDLDYYE